jgi:hypothetical protein
LDEVARRLVDVAEREDARRRRRLPGWVRDVPRFAVAAALAGLLVFGLITVISSDDRAPTPPAASADQLGPGEYWYVRTRETYLGSRRPSTRIDETWARADGKGRVAADGRSMRLRLQGFALEIGQSELTYDEVQALPADPAALRAELARYVKPDRNGVWLVQAVSGLLTPRPWPVPQATRAAAIEALRAEPRIAVNEIGGRRVMVQTRAARFGSFRMIIDTRTSTLVEGSRWEKGKEVQRGVVEQIGVVRSTRERPGSDPRIDRTLIDNLAVFRRPQRESEVPRRWERRYYGVDPKDLDFDNGRMIGRDRDGDPVYVIPGKGVVCMTGGGCTETARIARGEAAVGWSGCNSREVHAIVPDSARNVHINRADGSRIDVTVRDSAVIARVESLGSPDESGALVWDHPGGRFALAIHGCG